MTAGTFSKIKRVLIANRGEIACRIIKTCKEHNLTSIAVYSKEDLESMHVSEADEAVLLPGTGAPAYINIENLVEIAKEKKADVVVPGYGFLSENSEFAGLLVENGIAFAGPSASSVEQFGLKHLARKLAMESDVPVVPGTDLISDKDELVKACNAIGYPVILKATAGGGGMGMKVCSSEEEVDSAFEIVVSKAGSLFKNEGVFAEKYIRSGRHIEVQLFGDGLGNVVTFGERECSIQRRHQKVIEETPSPFVQTLGVQYELRKHLTACAKRLAETVKYKSAGTIEFLVDDTTGDYYFLEMNTRLQVEHGITELVYGIDLVYFMLMQAEYELAGSGIPNELLKKSLKYDSEGVEIPHGHAIEVRVYAENPIRDFAPSPGILHYVEIPKADIFENCQVRIDHWISTGGKVSPYFDPLLAKVMVWSPERTSENIIKALKALKIMGPINNIEYCIDILKSTKFRTGDTLTDFLSSFSFEPHLIEFQESGAYTTIQDLPGRRASRNGVPISGPSDPLSLQLANIIVGNDKYCEALEINVKGPCLKFHKSAIVSIAGGAFEVLLNDKIEVPMFTELFIPPGSILEIGDPLGKSSKCYLAVKGGFPGVAEYLGSKSCTPSFQLGGHQGRTFLPGDCLESLEIEHISEFKTGYKLPKELLPTYERDENVIRVLRGPHDTPDITSEAGVKQLYTSTYSINFNSNRTAMRLDGPAFIFGRTHGGDGGGHPTNILEYPYPTRGLSAVGSTMVLFGADGATLSGFVCLSVPIETDFWKFAQAAINSPLKFKLITFNDAIKLMKQREEFLRYVETRPTTASGIKFEDDLEAYETVPLVPGEFLFKEEAKDSLPYVAFREGGERMILIDFGVTKFDLFNNGRQFVFELEIQKLLKDKVEAVECDSGAMCVTFDPLKVDRDELLKDLIKIERTIPPVESLKVPSRIFRLPICFEHTALDHCLERYTHSQRPHASYLPSNLDYLMKANCLETIDDFKKCIVDQTEIVVAVSFFCANPLLVLTDPRKRFITSKYNPARTFTPVGAVGSGSVSQSIYSVESPGGYMIWGMTLPNWYWDTFSRIHEKPWPLKNFDQVVYYEVDEEELGRLNTQLITKKLTFEPEECQFDFVEYKRFMDSIKDESEALLAKKKQAFQVLLNEEERDLQKWADEQAAAKASKSSSDDILSDPNAFAVASHMPSNVFKINVTKGDIVTIDDVLIILEAMKMEIPVKIKDKKASSEAKFEVLRVIVDEGDVVGPGDTLIIMKKI